eukprot:596915-Lingulodinium_polyedra.AAC.1
MLRNKSGVAVGPSGPRGPMPPLPRPPYCSTTRRAARPGAHLLGRVAGGRQHRRDRRLPV